jgi:hypothetical protein
VTETWTHHKRGGRYERLTDSAHLQCSTEPRFEDQFGNVGWTVYRNIDTGMVYIRLTSEFEDGRFTLVNDG